MDVASDSVLSGDLALMLVSGTLLVLSTAGLAFAIWVLTHRLAVEREASRLEALRETWIEIILDALAGDSEPESLRSTVAARDEPACVDLLLGYARRLRGQDRVRLAELAAPFLAGVRANMVDPSPEQRALAIETLSLLGDGQHHKTIRGALDDPSPLVVMIAVRALTRDEGPEYLADVMDRLYRLDSWSTRLLASMMASIGADAAPALREALADPGRAAVVRTVSAEALRQLNDLASAEVAYDILSEEQDREVVAAALRLLTRVGRPEQAAAVRIHCYSPDYVVRAHAVTAVAALGSSADVELLTKCLDDASSWVAIHAASGLVHTGQLGRLREIAVSDHPRAELAQQVLREAA